MIEKICRLAPTHRSSDPCDSGQKVMVDADLARLCEVPTKAFNQAVKRNMERFPEDFAFQRSKSELEQWRSQIVTSNPSAKMGL
jgi:ORF6N domain